MRHLILKLFKNKVLARTDMKGRSETGKKKHSSERLFPFVAQ